MPKQPIFEPVPVKPDRPLENPVPTKRPLTEPVPVSPNRPLTEPVIQPGKPI
jgi:hypothetical protein